MGPKKKIKNLSHLYSLVQLEKEPAPLTEEDVKNLLISSSYKSHATGLLEENITDTTVRNRLSLLKRAIKLFTRRQYSSAENKDIENYIKKELVYKGKISTDAYKKLVAPLLVAEDLI
ncbi:unnamed protein product [Alternaria alternata]